MKDKLSDQKIDEIIFRAQQLTPLNKPLWGNLSVTGMLYHCTIVNNRIMDQKQTRQPKLKERIFKIALYLIKKLPKGIKTNPALLPPQQDDLILENEVSNFIKTLSRFKDHKLTLKGVHPVFGPLHTNEWRRFVWLHLDHHLRQFGV